MYELSFWKYLDGIYLNNQEVYEWLEDEQTVDGLELLPVEIIINRISNAFSNWSKVDSNSWQNPNGAGAFQIKTLPQSIKIDCYGTEGKTMDYLVALLEEFKCPLYDPQVPERYDDFN